MYSDSNLHFRSVVVEINKKEKVVLSVPSLGLIIPPLIWSSQRYSTDKSFNGFMITNMMKKIILGIIQSIYELLIKMKNF